VSQALRLAENLEEMAVIGDMGRKPDPKDTRRQAAIELRRLQAENEAFSDVLGALKLCAAVCSGEITSKSGLINALEKARSAMQKAEGVQPRPDTATIPCATHRQMARKYAFDVASFQPGACGHIACYGSFLFCVICPNVLGLPVVDRIDIPYIFYHVGGVWFTVIHWFIASQCSETV